MFQPITPCGPIGSMFTFKFKSHFKIGGFAFDYYSASGENLIFWKLFSNLNLFSAKHKSAARMRVGHLRRFFNFAPHWKRQRKISRGEGEEIEIYWHLGNSTNWKLTPDRFCHFSLNEKAGEGRESNVINKAKIGSSNAKPHFLYRK